MSVEADNHAIISDCREYRYRLQRRLSDRGLTYAFFGINPSTADAFVDDQTLRKVIGFCRQWGAGTLIIGNVFGYRSKDVKSLASCADATGKENHIWLRSIIRDADVLVPCWGSRTKIPKVLRSKLDALMQTLLASGKPVSILGRTASGDPLHPLMVSYQTPLRAISVVSGAL